MVLRDWCRYRIGHLDRYRYLDLLFAHLFNCFRTLLLSTSENTSR